MSAKVTSKGQVTIPKRIRDALRLRQGTMVDFIVEGGRAFIEPVRKGGVEALAGSLKSYAGSRVKIDERRLLKKVRERVAESAAKEGLIPRHKRHPQVSARR